MGLLDELQAEALRRHANGCERCQARSRDAAAQHAVLVEALSEFDSQHDQRREQLLAMLPAGALASPGEAGVAGWRQRLATGDFAMILRQHKTRWAAVATLAAAGMVVAIMLATGGRTAFADAMENMRQAKTMTCDVVTTVDLTKSGPGVTAAGLDKPVHGKMSMYAEGETRSTLYEAWMPELDAAAESADDDGAAAAEAAGSNSSPAGKQPTMRMLYVGDDAYVWAGGKLQVLTSLDMSRQPGPQQWLDQLLKYRDDPDRRLGEKLIGGRPAQGFEIAGWKANDGAQPPAVSPAAPESQAVVQVWVDVEQDLPVQIEFSQPIDSPQMKGTVHAVFENMRWNVPLDPAEFQPPSQGELAQAQTIAMPAFDEATFVKFMRAWLAAGKQAEDGMKTLEQKAKEKGEPLPAELTALVSAGSPQGGYPEKLDPMWLSGAYVGRLTIAKTVEQLVKQKPLPDGLPDAERQQMVQQRAFESAQATAEAIKEPMIEAMAAGAFYQRLATDGRQPEYFGATVEPGDAAGVLLKWQLEDGRTRVIYGDLHAETVQ
ncbi:MAG: hypothetical protein CMJ58_11165 [Planctomycetaceae bacterium]|nr:hypothetical protein [Planctomycetaceae bacterium]